MFYREKVEVEFSQIYKIVGLGIIIWFFFVFGVLIGKYLDKFLEGICLGMEGFEWFKDFSLIEECLEKVWKFSKIVNDLGIFMFKFVIVWCLINFNVSIVIFGGLKVNYLEENIDVLELVFQLSEEVLNCIEEVLGNKFVYLIF